MSNQEHSHPSSGQSDLSVVTQAQDDAHLAYGLSLPGHLIPVRGAAGGGASYSHGRRGEEGP